MPTGRLRPGRVRVAGVTSAAVLDELRKLMEERVLPSLSQAVGVALEEWLSLRRSGVLNPGGLSAEMRTREPRTGVLNPRESREERP